MFSRSYFYLCCGVEMTIAEEILSFTTDQKNDSALVNSVLMLMNLK